MSDYHTGSSSKWSSAAAQRDDTANVSPWHGGMVASRSCTVIEDPRRNYIFRGAESVDFGGVTDQSDSLGKISAIREKLIAELAILDALGKQFLAGELGAVIELINKLLQ